MGKGAKAATAVTTLRRTCEEELKGKYELKVIDVLEHPELAEADNVLATPTLIKQLPPPLRRLIGDLSNAGGGEALRREQMDPGVVKPAVDLAW